ncbi:mandelate racemase/muconate lactonizing enzyme family protein [uncultured Microbacterium sp.]|uniref:mandelate racemase/muconate lactonizing enzyme family protein n=1 Tax=uncultured Microbacterium sp. TaxID=191216 RepID=UPI0035C99CB4
MRITRVQVFTYDAAYRDGVYGISGGRAASSQRSLVVRIDTDRGITGWGEICPHGRTYLPSFFEGELAALGVLAPALIGQDPRNLGAVGRIMDHQLLANNPAKAALDSACWDIFGKVVDLPVSELLGGRLTDTLPLFTSLPVAGAETQARHAVDELRAGFRVFQVKVGDDPVEDSDRVRAVVDAVGPNCTVLVDANGGWTLTSALIAANRLADLPVRLEQPCRSMADCAELRAHTNLPLILDESVVTFADLVHARHVVGATGINLKPSRVGGLTKARLMRDAAQALGMTFTVDDTWGSSLATAQIAAVGAGAQPELLTGVTNFATVTTPQLGAGVDQLQGGRSTVPTASGLGVDIDAERFTDALVDTAACIQSPRG